MALQQLQQQQQQNESQLQRRRKSNSVGSVHTRKALKIRTRRTSRSYKPRHAQHVQNHDQQQQSDNQYVQYSKDWNRRLSRGMSQRMPRQPSPMMYASQSHEEITTHYPFNNQATNYMQSPTQSPSMTPRRSPQSVADIYSPHGSIEQMNIHSPPSLDIQKFLPAENPKFTTKYKSNKY